MIQYTSDDDDLANYGYDPAVAAETMGFLTRKVQRTKTPKQQPKRHNHSPNNEILAKKQQVMPAQPQQEVQDTNVGVRLICESNDSELNNYFSKIVKKINFSFCIQRKTFLWNISQNIFVLNKIFQMITLRK